MDEVNKYNIPPAFLQHLQNGEDYVDESGSVIKNELLTIASEPPKVYAYCADTIYDEELVDKIKNVDLLYHESTYLSAFQEKAANRFHCSRT